MNDSYLKLNISFLFLGIITSACNIVPLLILPLFGVVSLFVVSLFLNKAPMDVKVYKDFRFWFIAFTVCSITFAALTGVNVFEKQLYRREFKFIVPFTFLILFSSIYYPKNLERQIKYTISFVSIVSFLWFIVSIFYPFHSKALYPYTGSPWKEITGILFYTGPFQSHSAAGGFYAVLTAMQVGFLHKSDSMRLKVALWSGTIFSATCLFYTGSRAFSLGVFFVAFVLLIRTFLTTKNYKPKTILLLLIGVIASAGLFKTMISPLMSDLNEISAKSSYSKDVRVRNGQVRLLLWGLALKDFKGSPLIGIGSSRFDDRPELIRQLPIIFFDFPESLKNKNSTYLDMPYFRVNVSPFSLHTDKHAHNLYLHLLAEGGILFFSFFVIAYYKLIKKVWRIYRNGSDAESSLAEGTLGAIACVATASFFGLNLLTVIPMVTVFVITGYLLAPKVSRVAGGADAS